MGAGAAWLVPKRAPAPGVTAAPLPSQLATAEDTKLRPRAPSAAPTEPSATSSATLTQHITPTQTGKRPGQPPVVVPRSECRADRCTASDTAQKCEDGKWLLAEKCPGGSCYDSGTCGVCAKDTFSCPNQVGLLCSASGQWLSNGSSDACHCTAPGARFLRVGAKRVRDTKTSLTWESVMRPPAAWADAGSRCNNAGMRLPTMAEWRGLIIPTKEARCLPGLAQSLSPFDDAAFPGVVANHTVVWTGTTENGFAGNVSVVHLAFDFKSGWAALESDDVTKSTILHPYRCVTNTR